MNRGNIAILSVMLASTATAQDGPDEADAAVTKAEAERLAELAYIAQELGVPVPLGQGTGSGLFDERPSDYPPDLWVARKEGRSGIAVPVDRMGNPTACRITQSSGYDAFDRRICELTLERAKFQPALDENGDPVEAEYLGSYSWRIREPSLPNSFSVSVSYTVTAEGEVVDCEVLEASGELTSSQRERLENQPCPASSFIDRRVYRDDKGVPVARRVTSSSSVELSDPAPAAIRE